MIDFIIVFLIVLIIGAMVSGFAFEGNVGMTMTMTITITLAMVILLEFLTGYSNAKDNVIEKYPRYEIVSSDMFKHTFTIKKGNVYKYIVEITTCVEQGGFK